jgi:hypothetical protein
VTTEAPSHQPQAHLVRVIALLLAVFWGYVFFGVYDLFVFLQGSGFHESFHLETGWGLFFLFIVAAPLIAVTFAPETVLPAALQQVLLACVALAVAAVLSASPKHLLPAAGLGATTALVAAVSARVRVARAIRRRWSWGPGAFVVVGAGPWFAYALAMAETARARRHVSLTWSLNHWPVQAALAVGIVLVAALVATFPPGWPISTWCVGVCAVWFGVACCVYPDLDASLGRLWGAAAIAWGLGFVAATHLAAAGRPSATHRSRTGGDFRVVLRHCLASGSTGFSRVVCSARSELARRDQARFRSERSTPSAD